MSFDSLGLSEPLLQAIRDKGYDTPSPIQLKAIPAILTGRDVLAAAQTGTGKTAGFALPILEKLAVHQMTKGKRPVRSLIMTPTRELAAQVAESIKVYGVHMNLRCVVVFGGVGINPQIAQLRGGIDIVVATPGRLLDLVNHKAIDLSQVEILVLDEADRMLDMGFIIDIRKILKLLPVRRQNLLFSATFSKEIRDLTNQVLKNPLSIEVVPPNTASELVDQLVYKINPNSKPSLLRHLIKEGDWEQVLVFTRTKHGANRLCEKLNKSNIPSLAIHGNKSQNARTLALSEFKSGKIRVLVATDIAARGLDIKQLPHVVNYELPNVPEDYVHRIGRTGRAGATGHAVSLVSDEEVKHLRGIEKLLNIKIPTGTPSAFEDKSEPSDQHKNESRPERTFPRGHNQNKSATSKFSHKAPWEKRNKQKKETGGRGQRASQPSKRNDKS